MLAGLDGLGSDDARQSFVNQLQMTLFTWIKQNPSLTSRLYVLDEAQNFAPSQAGTACKASALSLAAQARKYGLGMIFATQLPKGIRQQDRVQLHDACLWPHECARHDRRDSGVDGGKRWRGR